MKNNKGFTLMELLLSISVLALIMLIAVPSYIGISNAVRKNQRENIISKIETAASKYAFDTGETLIFVDKLITEGYLDSDDEKGNLDDPVNNLRMNCYVVEMTRENSYYKAEFKNDKNYDEDGVCNYNKLEESSSNVSIIATGEKIGDWYKGKVTLTATSNKVVIDCTNNTCKWTSSSGLDKNGESIEVDSKGILNTKYTFQYTIYNQEDNTVTRYKDAMTLKIDNEAPVIYNEQITVTDRYVYTDKKTVKIIASDGKGSGISGYALSKDVSVCSASELKYQESNSFKVEEAGTYKVCVKDKVNNYSEYNLEIKYINPKYTVKVSSNNESYGTVNPGSQPVTSGKSAVFTISPKDGYQYKSNTCDGTVSDNILTIENVTTNKTCIVNFEKIYTVTASSNNTSYGTVSPESQTVSSGNLVTFTLSPATGYQYSSNDCGGTVSGNRLTISNVTTDKTCKVTFEKSTYTVTVSSNSTTRGTVSPSSQTVSHGGTLTFTISPKSGYEYSSNTCGGTISGNTLTISNVTSNKNCTVSFVSNVVKYRVQLYIYDSTGELLQLNNGWYAEHGESISIPVNCSILNSTNYSSRSCSGSCGSYIQFYQCDNNNTQYPYAYVQVNNVTSSCDCTIYVS